MHGQNFALMKGHGAGIMGGKMYAHGDVFLCCFFLQSDPACFPLFSPFSFAFFLCILYAGPFEAHLIGVDKVNNCKCNN